jgi:hypothetical protein
MNETLTDNPVSTLLDDHYGIRPYIEELHNAVATATSLPLTVGIFGAWGSGKSSFMRMWEDHLSSGSLTHTLWFNPWKYDRKVEVWSALIQSLLAEMQEEGSESLATRARRLARTATWLTLRTGVGIAGAALTGGVVDRGTFDKFIDDLTADDASYYRELNRFESDFARAVGEFVGEHGRLVVFVDDLDRCTPDAAMNVLEALKLFVGDARCIFVLAMDFDLLAAVATSKFGSAVPVTGAAYLEKIVQLPFFLPEIAFSAIRSSLSSHVGDLSEDDAFWELVELGFGSNPRRVKRFVNVFNLAVAIAQRDGGLLHSFDRERYIQIAKLLIFRSEHREFFRLLLADPDAWRRLENSPALPRPGSNDPTEVERERDPILAKFLRMPELVRLLAARPGAYNDFPPAPAGNVVERMLRTVMLFSGVEHASADEFPTGANS